MESSSSLPPRGILGKLKENTPQVPKRPVWVWVIAAFYVVTAGSSLTVRTLIYLGAYPLQGQTESLTQIDRTLFDIALAVTQLLAGVWLWLLRKRAFELFLVTLLMSLWEVLWGFSTLSPLQDALVRSRFPDPETIFYIMIGRSITIVICLYVWRLRRRGVIK